MAKFYISSAVNNTKGLIVLKLGNFAVCEPNNNTIYIIVRFLWLTCLSITYIIVTSLQFVFTLLPLTV